MQDETVDIQQSRFVFFSIFNSFFNGLSYSIKININICNDNKPTAGCKNGLEVTEDKLMLVARLIVGKWLLLQTLYLK